MLASMNRLVPRGGAGSPLTLTLLLKTGPFTPERVPLQSNPLLHPRHLYIHSTTPPQDQAPPTIQLPAPTP